MKEQHRAGTGGTGCNMLKVQVSHRHPRTQTVLLRVMGLSGS